MPQWSFPEWKISNEFGIVILKSNLQAKIFDLLWRKQGIKGITRQRIIDIIYADDINGGPEVSSISQEMYRIRLQLLNIGIFLKRGFSGGEGYSLFFTTPQIARNLARKQSYNLGCKPKIKQKRHSYYKERRLLETGL